VRLHPAGSRSISRTCRGMTLVEVMMSVLLYSIVAFGALQAMQIYHLLDQMAKEEAIAASYMEDYLENCQQLGYLGLHAGAALPDGPCAGRTIPAYSSDTWTSLDANELAYFPDLAYVVRFNVGGNRVYPQIQTQIQTIDDSLNGTGSDYKIVTLNFRWVPLGRNIKGASRYLTRTMQIRCYSQQFY